jgi:hypothetical protein
VLSLECGLLRLLRLDQITNQLWYLQTTGSVLGLLSRLFQSYARQTGGWTQLLWRIERYRCVRKGSGLWDYISRVSRLEVNSWLNRLYLESEVSAIVLSLKSEIILAMKLSPPCFCSAASPSPRSISYPSVIHMTRGRFSNATGKKRLANLLALRVGRHSTKARCVGVTAIPLPELDSLFTDRKSYCLLK